MFFECSFFIHIRKLQALFKMKLKSNLSKLVSLVDRAHVANETEQADPQSCCTVAEDFEWAVIETIKLPAPEDLRDDDG